MCTEYRVLVFLSSNALYIVSIDVIKVGKIFDKSRKIIQKTADLVEEGIGEGKSLKLYHSTKHVDCQVTPDDEGSYLLRYFPIRSVRAQNCCSLLRCSRKLVNSPLASPRNSVRVTASTTGFAEALLAGAATLE